MDHEYDHDWLYLYQEQITRYIIDEGVVLINKTNLGKETEKQRKGAKPDLILTNGQIKKDSKNGLNRSSHGLNKTLPTDVSSRGTSSLSTTDPHKLSSSWSHNSIQSKLSMNSGKLNIRRSSFPTRKKSEVGKIPTIKGLKKSSARSPSLSKKLPSSPENAAGTKQRSVAGATNLLVPSAEEQQMVRSTEDLESVEVSSRENGSSGEGGLDELDGASQPDTQTDTQKTKAALDQLKSKITKTMDLIKAEQTAKEENVNEYLKLAAGADKQQCARIKAVFEKKNQKSTQSISNLQKKLETYHKRKDEVETYGVPGHKQAKEVLRDMGHGLKGVGANIMDGITGFSGGVVDNIKGAKDTIVSKPKEFAHLIKNKFGSADNISHMKTMDDAQPTETEGKGHGGTLPASFKYGSEEEENSSITSGSGFGAQSSPPSLSQNAPQQAPMVSQAQLEPFFLDLREELRFVKEQNEKLADSVIHLTEELDHLKRGSQHEFQSLRTMLDEERYRTERLEEQINDMTELHQNEVSNLRQDISSMEEKIEYRLDERTSDIHDLLENCQTRVTKMELQQQQQQIISMEMVENVTFRTLLTKLINVVLAIVGVILVFVSTASKLVAPFLTTRARIISTSILIFALVIFGRNADAIFLFMHNVWTYITNLLPNR